MHKKITWKCPSNIAIVKYWGKKDNQIPANPSVSMSLSNSYTEIGLELKEKQASGIELDFQFEGQQNPKFEKRILDYLEKNKTYFPFLNTYSVHMCSKNSFPHSAGIASSASAFGAIALSLLDVSEPELYDTNPKEFLQKASFLARLGSGSACRSMFSEYAIWGENKAIQNSSNEFAIALSDIHKNFKDFQDSILIIDEKPKKVSSSLGHSLMNEHPYADQRFKQAEKRSTEIVDVLSTGNLERFIEITESEALTLHSMMMTSKNPYLLMKPGTLLAIEKIQNFRIEKDLPICFTLDAGPNVHVLYPSEINALVMPFLNDLMGDNSNKIIHDNTGKGPEKLQ